MNATQNKNVIKIGPQPGPQSDFLRCRADIAIFGGSAGGGKSYALLLEPLRHVTNNPAFAAIFFRRTTTQITNPGGLWDASMRLYGRMTSVTPRLGSMEWVWKDGGKVKFSHLEHEQSKLNHQGAEYPLLCCEANEKVRMADGSLKAVHAIRVNEEVLTLRGPRKVLFAGGKRLEECVRAVVRDQSGSVVGEQIHSQTHAVLCSAGWASYRDISRKVGPIEAYAPIQSRVADKSSSLSPKRPEADQRGFVECNSALSPSAEGQQRVRECQTLSFPFGQRGAPEALLFHETFASRESCAYGISAQPSEPTCLSPMQSHDTHIRDQAPGGGQPQLPAGCRYGSESVVYRAQEDQGNDCGSSDDSRRVISQQASEIQISVMLHAPHPQSDTFESDVAPCEGEVSCALTECRDVSYQLNYLSSPHPNDEHPGIEEESNLGVVQQLACVEQQTPRGSQRDASDKVRKYSHRQWRYVHPYRDEERLASEGVSLGSCSMVPCGKRWVIDLTIAGEAHYITESGLVNKNCFDELTHFSASQFWYLVSRNRSMSGVRGYVRATCNPDADSWVAEFISWWISQDTGLPIPERSGVLRWMIRVEDTLHWADTKEELIERFKGRVPDEALMPKSVTFIPARLTDNPALMRADPGYLANLLSLQAVERGRLLDGNWRIRPSAGLYFQRRWLKPLLAAPSYVVWCRAWDLAATPKTETNNPDFTESVLMGKTPDGIYILADHTSMRGSPSQVEAEILRVARQDRNAGLQVTISLPQDPAQAGKAQVAAYAKLLSGYTVRTSPESRQSTAAATGFAAKAAKIGRFGPFSAQCEAGMVYYLAGDWDYTALFDKLESFPEASKDDAADACSRAFAQLGDNVYDSSLSWVDALAEL